MVSAEWCRVAVDVLPMAVTVDGASMSASVESKAVPMETWMGTALYAVILWLIMKAVCGSVLTFLAEHGLTRANYRGEVVPTGAGLLLWLALLVDLAFAPLWQAFHAGQALSSWQAVHAEQALSSWRQAVRFDFSMFALPSPARMQEPAGASESAQFFPFCYAAQWRFALLATVVFFAGWLDDTVGNRTVKGFRGHVRAWLREGRITTGLVKAGAVCSAAAWASWQMGGSAVEWAVRTLVIALTANALNLLDLRPGRALKAFFLLAAVIAAVSWTGGNTADADTAVWRQMLPLAAAAVVLFRYDLRSRAMLGDTGANLLGFALGYAAASVCPLWFLIGLLVLLAWLHWIAERRSISGIIEKNAALSWLDGLGRRG